MLRQNYIILVLTSPEKQFRILVVQPAEIHGYFNFSVKPILPWVNKMYLFVCIRRFNSDFFWGGDWVFGILFSVLLCIFLLAVSKHWQYSFRFTLHTER